MILFTMLGRYLKIRMPVACLRLFSILWLITPGLLYAEGLPPGPAGSPPAATDAILIEAGAFVMGSNRVDTDKLGGEFGVNKPWYLDEHPEHRETVQAFLVDRFEVTNAQYATYARTQKADVPPYWMKNGYLLALAREQLPTESEDRLRRLVTEVFKLDVDASALDKAQLEALIGLRLRYLDNVPVVSVTWFEADAYCRWRGARLPTEKEWERIARGVDGREFPWGNDWKAGVSHTGENPDYDDVAPVDAFASDVTPEGVRDIAGNVSEWVADWYQPYSGADFKSTDFGETSKVVRGSSWSDGAVHYNLRLFQRSAYRFYLPPDGRYEDVGFRCVTDAGRADKSS